MASPINSRRCFRASASISPKLASKCSSLPAPLNHQTFGPALENRSDGSKQRRELMGEAMGVLVNGEIPGCKWKRRVVQSWAMRWNLQDIGGGECMGGRGYEVGTSLLRLSECTGETIFPPGSELQLRADHWSAGAARVAVRQGLQANHLIWQRSLSGCGGRIPCQETLASSDGRLGAGVEERRKDEAEQVYAEEKPVPAEQVVKVSMPYQGQANGFHGWWHGSSA